MEKIKDKYLGILWIICVICLFIFVGHYGEILIDFGREVYYPEQILNGKILYKDLFNIYGSLAYQINAVLYKIFGAKLSTLFGCGVVFSLLTVSGIYLVAEKFLSKFLSFCIGIFTIAVGVATVSIFNFHFPYSWAVLYGLAAFLYSLYFLLNNNEKSLCISAFLAGICITCKYDFLLYGLVVLFFILKSKNWKALLCFASIPIISFGILFLQGLKVSDLANSFEIVKTMAKSKTLTYFYQNSGIYFHPKALFTDLILFIKFVIPFAGVILGGWLINKNKFAGICAFLLSLILSGFLFDIQIGFGFLPLFLLILSIISYKKFDTKLLILVLCTLCVCAKVFWVLIMNSYGNYYMSIVLTAFLALLFRYLPSKYEKFTGIYLIILSVLMFLHNIQSFPNSKIETQKGVIYTSKNLAESTNALIKELKPDEKAVIFPEGMIVNFLSKTGTDDFYNSMLPLYVETFGEEKFVKYYKKVSPDFIIFNNKNMKDYYFEYICRDYAKEFCGFVHENYSFYKVIGQDVQYVIFKKQ